MILFRLTSWQVDYSELVRLGKRLAELYACKACVLPLTPRSSYDGNVVEVMLLNGASLIDKDGKEVFV